MGFFQKQETEEQQLKRLSQGAGNIIAMLKHVLKGERGTDLTRVLLYASGLAGHACHEAVKAEKKPFARVTTEDGKQYYFGDAVNHYLLEDRLSVLSFITPVCPPEKEDVLSAVTALAQKVGREKLTVWGAPAEAVYCQIRDCWKGIYDNMTSKYAKNASEWPLLYAIVLQNVLAECLQAGAPRDEAGKMALECALVISRMDEESL